MHGVGEQTRRHTHLTNSTNVPSSAYGVSHTGWYTPVCAGGMFSPCFDLMSMSNQYPDESSYKYSSDVWRNVDPPQSVLFERSTWRFAADFSIAGANDGYLLVAPCQYDLCDDPQ